MLDLTEEFYLETIDRIFQRAELAAGSFTYRGRRVDPGAIRNTALLTVEGGRDDICALGQTAVAHELCTALRPHLSATTCRRTSATTASSTAGAGRTRSIRWCAT